MTEMNIQDKVYGISFPTRKSNNQPVKLQKSVFDADSDVEIDKAPLTKNELEKALQEDATIFQYDEFFDSKTDVEKSHETTERKLERELCAERKAQREIELESNLYPDKESFVTSAYKEKLNELRNLIDKRKDEEHIEGVMDITKQDGLTGFYKYMLNSQDSQNLNKIEDSISSNQDDATELTNNTSQTSPQSNVNNDDVEVDEKQKFHEVVVSDKSAPPSNPKLPISSAKVLNADFILAKPCLSTDEEIAAARERYFARKDAGIHPIIVDSD